VPQVIGGPLQARLAEHPPPPCRAGHPPPITRPRPAAGGRMAGVGPCLGGRGAGSLARSRDAAR
jgi:hypothetical protein